MKAVKYIFWLWIAIGYVNSQAQVSVPAILSKIHQHMNQKQINGMAMGFVTAKEEGVYTYGYADRANKQKITEQTLFELGEVSETFTTAMMIDMYFEDELNIYHPLAFYVPPYVEVPCYQEIVCTLERPGELTVPPNVEGIPLLGGISCYAEIDTPIIPITFCRLATHHGGIPSTPEQLNKYRLSEKKKKSNFTPEQTKVEELYQVFMQQELMTRPGTQYHYSNIGTAVLGQVLAYQEQITYSQLLERKISTPLGLLHTVTEPNEQEKPLMARGYDYSGKTIAAGKWEGFTPAEGIRSTPEDMMIYLAANVGVLQAEPLQAAFDECHVPHGLVRQKGWEDLRTGYGWFVQPLNKGDTYRIWSEGSTEGFAAFIGLIPEKQAGIFIMTNSPKNLRSLGFELLELVEEGVGDQQIDWREQVNK